MVDRTDLAKVNQLYDESNLIDRAIDNFDHGGVIIAMSISGAPLDAPPPPGESSRSGVTLSTTAIAYPPAMVDAIKTALTARLGEIDQELGSLGVTGFEARATRT